MNTKKMIVMDLDGTLLNEKSKVNPKTKDYINNLKQEGYIIVIATGRILKSTINTTDGAEFANYIITDSGATAYKKRKGKWEEVYLKLIPKKIAKDIVSMYDERKFKYIDICSKNYIDRYTTEYFSESVVARNYKDKNKILENINEISHISVRFLESKFENEYKEIWENKYPELDVKIGQNSFEDDKWIEISQKDVQKYNGIYEIAKIENVENKDIIAFGDGLNDIDMIEKCGVGVAMKNSLEVVKEKADFVTYKSNGEDGIIDFLDKFLTKN